MTNANRSNTLTSEMDEKKIPMGIGDGALFDQDAIRYLPAAEVLTLLNCDREKGLSEAEVTARRIKFGWNEISKAEGISTLQILFRQFQSSVVLLLGLAVVASIIMREYLQAAGIIVVLLINAILGAATEYKAQVSLAALMKLFGATARVRRGGSEQYISVRELVPGDIVVLAPGERVPADVRVVECANLSVDESAVSGESTPIYKEAFWVEGNDAAALLFQGTLMLSGRCIGVVTATGKQSTLGKLGTLVQTISKGTTPLEQQLADLGDDLTKLTIVVCAIIGLIGVLHRQPPLSMLETSVTLAVAAIPEALPLVATLAMALGIARMIQAQAIIRKLPAVETLGCTSVICTDKTGTLTENKMMVSKIVLLDHHLELSGAGYAPVGLLTESGQPVDPQLMRDTERLLVAAALCNDACLEMHDSAEGWHVHGDPTEGALLTAAAKIGLSATDLKEAYPRLTEVPFDLSRRRMSTIHSLTNDQSVRLCLKGAPEMVIPLCSDVMRGGKVGLMSAKEREFFERENERLAEEGLRVLAIARRKFVHSGAEKFALLSDPRTFESSLTLLGLVGISDQPRSQAKEAVGTCQQAGIRVIMLTGDQLSTAKAVARQLGIIDHQMEEEIAVNAANLETMPDSEVKELLRKTHVLARLAPESKLRIVRLLQESGEVVAMTGDGVNDAPALKQADIGVAMGREGSELACESASLVITDDNFATIVKAVEYGRLTYDNIQRCVAYLLTASLTSVAVVTLGIFTDTGLLLKPMQLLCLNLIMHVFPALGLVVQTYDRGLMKTPPRNRSQRILSLKPVLQIIFRSTLISVVTLGCVLSGALLPEHHSTAVLFCSSLNLIVQSWLWLPKPSKLIEVLNPKMIACTAIALLILGLSVYWPPLQLVLNTASLEATEVHIILISTLIVSAVTGLFSRGSRPGGLS